MSEYKRSVLNWAKIKKYKKIKTSAIWRQKGMTQKNITQMIGKKSSQKMEGTQEGHLRPPKKMGGNWEDQNPKE